jgi:hypothetical protein
MAGQLLKVVGVGTPRSHLGLTPEAIEAGVERVLADARVLDEAPHRRRERENRDLRVFQRRDARGRRCRHR